MLEHLFSRRWRALACSGISGAGLVVSGLLALPAAAASSAMLYVSPNGSTGAADAGCTSAAYSSISSAIGAASTGDTIVACQGTYDEGVTIAGKAITLLGSQATVDATGQTEGVVIEGPASAGSVLQGFTIEKARREGILVQGTSGVTVENNVVTGNDLSCQPQTGLDDCGEGIHLRAVTASYVTGNYVSGNTGGILVTDGIPAGSTGQFAFGYSTPYSGPSSGNVIEHNASVDNIWDCGITLPSHNSLAVSSNGAPQPAQGGVFGNTIENNVAEGDGTAGGGGGGILIAAPFPGTGSYDNTIEGNTVGGNGLPGILVHSHAPGQDVNGNHVLDNTVGTNAIGETSLGPGVFTTGGGPGDSDAHVTVTTGILVYSAVDHVSGTVVSGNRITGDHYGIWTSNVDTSGFSSNTFSDVTVPSYAEPAPGSGYLLVASDGGAFALGAMAFEGSAAGTSSTGTSSTGTSTVGVALTPDGGGYWIASSDGSVQAFGDATFHGSLHSMKLSAPVVGIAATSDGGGYWLVASDGGVFALGDATFHGSLHSMKLSAPVVGIAKVG